MRDSEALASLTNSQPLWLSSNFVAVAWPSLSLSPFHRILMLSALSQVTHVSYNLFALSSPSML